MNVETLSPGTWVVVRTEQTQRLGNGAGTRYIKRTVNIAARVVSVDGDSVTVERAELIAPKAGRAFGQRVDTAHYRVEYRWAVDAHDVLRAMQGREAAVHEDTTARIMRYPTYGQRRYAREQARKGGK